MMQDINKTNVIKIILQLLGILALSLLIWFLGPVISVADYTPLASVIVRVILISLIVILWGILFYLKKRKQNKEAEQLVEGLSESDSGDDSENRVDDEIDTLGQDFNEALMLLKTSNGGKSTDQLLYQLPWYIIIGPPGSGKTTALVNSGLEFPLADKLGEKAIKGVGGTRNCDWWFTDDAILIDTAGRYTTQDSHESVDKGGWLGFLDLLKKNRPRRPVNGAIIAMSLSDLLLQTDEEIKQHAKAIRSRISELDEKLGVEIPVYMMFTKCDLIAGFSEFFEDLDLEGRQQVWGYTLDSELERKDIISTFQVEYQALIQRLDDRLLNIIQIERDIQNRSLVFGYPRQMEGLESSLISFLDEVFGVNRYQKTSLLRGIYFTSGTQEGSPIDRLLGGLANSFGLDPHTAPMFSGQGKSYFITRLLNDVIFNEAELVGVDSKQEKRRNLLQMGVYALSCLALISMSLFWFVSYSKNNDAIATQQAYIGSYQDQPEQLRWQLDFKQLQIRMDALESASNNVYSEDDSWLMKFGLYQGEKLAVPAKQGYQRFLEKYFLPAIRYRFEERLQDSVSDSDELLYELLKVYLMLDNPEKLDLESLKAWVIVDWELEFADEEETLSSLIKHLDNLLALNPEPIKLNAGLIASVRRVLTQVPLAYQIYSRIKSETVENAYDLNAQYAMGRFGDRVFINVDGTLDQLRVPGLYTAQGYNKLFKKHSARIIKEALEQDWVLNRTEGGAASIMELTNLQTEIQALYIKEYIGYWNGFLSKIRIRDTVSAEDTTELIGYLSGKDSPLKKLLLEVEKNTTLSKKEKSVLGAIDTAKGGKINSKMKGVLDALKEKSKGGFDYSVDEIDQHFKKINQLVFHEKGQSPELDRYLSRFARIYSSLIDLQNKEIFSGGAGQKKMDGKLANDLQLVKYESKHLHGITQGWINSVVNKAQGEVTSNIQKQISEAWNNEVYIHCKNTLQGRYPLNKGSRREVNLTDFTKFYAKQGVMDSFFNQFLKGNIDTSADKWALTDLAAQTLSISRTSVRNFQYASIIKDKFFKYQNDKPTIQFSLKPLTRTEDIAKVVLEIDGQKMEFDDKPIRAKGFKWPGAGVGFVKIKFDYKDGKEKVVYQADGSWALFRLLDISASGKIRNSTERVNINLSAGTSTAKFELYTGGGVNPFAIDELRHFKCPKQL